MNYLRHLVVCRLIRNRPQVVYHRLTWRFSECLGCGYVSALWEKDLSRSPKIKSHHGQINRRE